MSGVAAFANECGVGVADAHGFVACLRVWTDKGYSVEQAIERHLAQMTRLLTLGDYCGADVSYANSEAGRELRNATASMLWDAHNGAAL